MNQPRVTIGLILYRGEKYLPYSIPSLLNQDHQNIEFLIRDQSPNGEAYDFLKKNFAGLLEAKKVQLEKGENLWHSGGHNSLIARMSGAYYIAASYDMLYAPDFVRKVVETLEKPENTKFGSATCKLMKWDFSEKDFDLERSKSRDIDSVGIGLTKGHYFFDYGQGQEDRGQFDQLKEVFGTSGALAIFRKEALEDIAYQKGVDLSGDLKRTPLSVPEYFDELLHYKNDIDLSYRLQWAGWPCLFIPEVKVWHDRQAESKGGTRSLLLNILKSRKGKVDWIKANSFFGHLVVLAKNYRHQPFSLSVRVRTGLMNFLKLCYILVFERALLQQYRKMKEHRPEIDAKTRAMKRIVRPIQIEKLMQ